MLTPDLIDRYRRHLAEHEHRAGTTVAGHVAELQVLVRRGIALEPDALARHLTWLPGGQPLSPTTRNRRLAVLRGLVRYLRAQGLLELDPLVGVKRGHVPRHVRSALTAEDVGRVMGVLVAEPPSRRRTRDATLLLLFYYTGLRLTELQRLDVHQVDLGARVLRGVRRKGGDHTDVVLHPCLVAQLRTWLAIAGRAGPLITTDHGDRLSRRMIQKRLHELGVEAGLVVPLHPHVLRHAHATGLLREGVSTSVIQQSMNHRALATTELYLHGDLQLVQQAVDKLPVLPIIPPDSSI